MASNRLYLVNDRLGLEVRLGTFSPCSWTIVPGIDERLEKAFAADPAISEWGNEDWRLRYEVEIDEQQIAETKARAEHVDPGYARLDAARAAGIIGPEPTDGAA